MDGHGHGGIEMAVEIGGTCNLKESFAWTIVEVSKVGRRFEWCRWWDVMSVDPSRYLLHPAWVG